jgi:ubiquinol-cytochrome c reductase cytochrome b subunit
VLAAVAVCAAVLGPFGPTGFPDPTIIQTVPKPDFYFLWLYAVLAYLPPDLETPFILTVPLLAIAVLVALPFYAGEGEKSWHRRPVAVLVLATVAVSFAVFTHLGTFTPWSPIMDAWSSATVPEKFLQELSPLERQGAVVFQAKQCRNCHSLDRVGGQRGPALDTVATRLTEDQLIRQVLQGGGNMPAYGKNLSPAETTALVKFLVTLHPRGQRPATNAAGPPTALLNPPAANQ